MDGLHRVAGSPGTLIVNGIEYRASPLKLKFRGEVEAMLVSRRASVLVEIERAMSDCEPAMRLAAVREAAKELANNRIASSVDVAMFLETLHGTAFTFFSMVRDNHPEITYERAIEIVSELDLLDAFKEALDVASGASDLKNSGGPILQSRAEKSQADFLGPESTGF